MNRVEYIRHCMKESSNTFSLVITLDRILERLLGLYIVGFEQNVICGIRFGESHGHISTPNNISMYSDMTIGASHMKKQRK